LNNLHLNVKQITEIPQKIIRKTVRSALIEDLVANDITSNIIINESKSVSAHIITNETMTLCGKEFFDEVYKQIDHKIQIKWFYKDKDRISANTTFAHLYGSAISILNGERTALNFIQLLSGIATKTALYVDTINDTQVRLLDTRKTLPNLRLLQKYAVYCGGGINHRISLFDAILIKDNHIVSSEDSIQCIIDKIKNIYPKKIIELEVRNLKELNMALKTKVDIIMLDNFTIKEIKQAVKLNSNKVKFEVSGNISLLNIKKIAETGINYISVGEITKNITPIDCTMKFI